MSDPRAQATGAQRLRVQVVSDFYGCFEHEDYDARVRRHLDPAVVWHIAGDNPLAGDVHGPDAVVAKMQQYAENSGGTLSLDTTVGGAGDHVIAVHTATAAVPRFDYATHEIDVFHVEGGLITAIWSFSEDQAATDRVWSSGN